MEWTTTGEAHQYPVAEEVTKTTLYFHHKHHKQDEQQGVIFVRKCKSNLNQYFGPISKGFPQQNINI